MAGDDKAAKLPKYKVLDRLKNGGEIYGPGVKGKESIEMAAELAQPLIDAGVLEAPKGKMATETAAV